MITPSIEAIVISPAHNYVGHHGRAAGTEPGVLRDSVRLIAGRGIEDDRYCQREDGHGKQITFFAMEVLDALAKHVGHAIAPGAVRRNVFTRGIDLNALIGRRFTLQGVALEGVEHCKPCYWMDAAVGPGAEVFLKDRGGLRARILSGDILRVGGAALVVEGAAV